jgi:multisubunit Na+/H+ antiporter MnhE subunit
MALWLWIDDTVAVPELVAGAVAAAIAAGAAELVLAQGQRPGRLRLAWLAHAWRLGPAVAVDLVRLLRVLVQRIATGRVPQGGLRAVRFRAGDLDDPDDTTRRALAKGVGSFAPNTIVLGIDVERNVMLVHQLETADAMKGADPLELG